MRSRDWVHKRAKLSGLPEDWTEYRQLRNLVSSMNRKARKIYFYAKLKETRARPKVFWNTLRKVIPGKNNLGEVEKLVINGKAVNPGGTYHTYSMCLIRTDIFHCHGRLSE